MNFIVIIGMICGVVLALGLMVGIIVEDHLKRQDEHRRYELETERLVKLEPAKGETSLGPDWVGPEFSEP